MKPFAIESDKGTVGRHELQQALVSTDKSFQGDAVIIIDEMVRMNKIRFVALDTYKKRGGKICFSDFTSISLTKWLNEKLPPYIR